MKMTPNPKASSAKGYPVLKRNIYPQHITNHPLSVMSLEVMLLQMRWIMVLIHHVGRLIWSLFPRDQVGVIMVMVMVVITIIIKVIIITIDIIGNANGDTINRLRQLVESRDYPFMNLVVTTPTKHPHP